MINGETMTASTPAGIAPRATPSAARTDGDGGYTGETYYGMPAVKPAPFTWHVSAYIFVSGLAGAAQIVAALVEHFGAPRMRTVVRNGRYLALGGAVVGPLLLIQDLKTPRRWYNMLRIFRRTSPMSIGSYILTAFGATSALTALGEALRRTEGPGSLARASSIPAAIAGAGMLTYTGALLSSTSTPLWAAESPLLAARFAATGIASGAAALALAEALANRSANVTPLERIASAATTAHTALSYTAKHRRKAAGVGAPLDEGRNATLYKVGDALLHVVPLACHALSLLGGRRSRALSVAAAISTIAGAALTRWAWVEAGKESAKRPAGYLSYTSRESQK